MEITLSDILFKFAMFTPVWLMLAYNLVKGRR